MRPVRRTFPVVLALVLAVLAAVLAPRSATAQDEERIEAARAAAAEVLPEQGNALGRSRRVLTLTGFDSAESARAVMSLLIPFAEKLEKREVEAEEARNDYQPYKGFFDDGDPAFWKIKARREQAMEDADEAVRADLLVSQAWMVAISKLEDVDGLGVFQKALGTASNSVVRRVLYGGLIRCPAIPAYDLAKKAMRDSDPGVRLLTLEALGDRKDPETVELAAKALKEKGWPHRQAAAFALGEMGDVRGVAALVDAMAVEDGRLIEDYAEALTKITGETLGPEPASWKGWYDDHKAELIAQGAKPKTTKRPKKTKREVVDFYGIKTRSKRVVFLIDVSGSMKEPIGAPPVRATTGDGAEAGPTGPKIDVAKKTLRQAIRALADDTYFNVIFFNHEIKAFSETMLKADQRNKNKAYLAIRELEAKGATYTYGALKECFHIAGRGVTDKAYDPGVDTIILLSDGAPTDSDIDNAQPMDAKVILDAVKGWNSLRKVRIHTIAIDPALGRKTFVRFMRALAASNRGTYTAIGSKE